MHAFTPETYHPSAISIPKSHIKLLDNFFIVDRLAPEPDAAEDFKDIFTADGVWKTPHATYTGTSERQKSGHLWTNLRNFKSMRHWVRKLFINDAEGKELMMLGRIRIEMLDGGVRDLNFGAHVVIEVGADGVKGDVNGHGEAARLKFFQGWSSAQ